MNRIRYMKAAARFVEAMDHTPVWPLLTVRVQPNMRLKLTAPVVCGKIAFVNVLAWRRSLGAPR